jgi:hypothetical protein
LQIASGREKDRKRKEPLPEGPGKEAGQDEPEVKQHEDHDGDDVTPLGPARGDRVEQEAAQTNNCCEYDQGSYQRARDGIRTMRLEPPGTRGSKQEGYICQCIDRLSVERRSGPFAIDIDGATEVRIVMGEQGRARERHSYDSRPISRSRVFDVWVPCSASRLENPARLRSHPRGECIIWGDAPRNAHEPNPHCLID